MFDDGERSAWKNIHAPAKLLSEIEEKLESEKCERKSIPYKRFLLPVTVAAIFALVIALIAFSNQSRVEVFVDNSTLITENGTDLKIPSSPMMARRSITPTCNVELTLDIDTKTRIIARNGVFDVINSSGEVLYSGSEYQADKSITLNWSYDLPEDDKPLVIELENSFKEYEIILEHNNETMTRNIKCVEK